MRLHIVHDPERNARIVKAARQQRTVHNVTVAHLLEHQSDEPVQRNTARGVTGLQGHWVEWRCVREDLAEIPSKVARGAIAGAADQVAKWEETNRRHAIGIVEAVENEEAIPRATQKRMPRPERLYRRRKAEERKGGHRVRIDEGVKRTGRRALYVPGVGELRTKEPIPESLDIRSCVLLERTPAVRLKRKPDEQERTFRIHASARMPKPDLKAPKEPGSCVGIDHGVVQAMTCVDDKEDVKSFQHDIEAAERADRRIRRTQRRTSNCRRGSQRWKRRKELVRRIRAKLCRQRRHNRVTWARELALEYDTICVEKLAASNMMRSARGTAEKHGRQVQSKAGLNRRLAGIAPAEQTALLGRACERAGTRIETVRAWRTSTTCNACGHSAPDNRESQAVFRCRRCGHTDNADVNAARNVRDRGIRQIRARVVASRGDENHLPKGTDAGARTERQEQSRRLEKKAGPQGHRKRGDRGSSTPTNGSRARESRPERKARESWPDGQYS